MNTSKHMEFRKKFVHSSFHGGWNRAESAVKDLWINLSVRLVLGIPTPRLIPDIFHTQTTQKHVNFSHKLSPSDAKMRYLFPRHDYAGEEEPFEAASQASGSMRGDQAIRQRLGA